jgi:hypothetical protein
MKTEDRTTHMFCTTSEVVSLASHLLVYLDLVRGMGCDQIAYICLLGLSLLPIKMPQELQDEEEPSQG